MSLQDRVFLVAGLVMIIAKRVALRVEHVDDLGVRQFFQLGLDHLAVADNQDRQVFRIDVFLATRTTSSLVTASIFDWYVVK